MTRGPRLAAIGLIAAALLAILVSGVGESAAQTTEIVWSLHARAGTTSFVAGAPLVVPGPGNEGYEIVSFGAVGPSAGLSTYVYGGADLPPPRGPAVPLITCDAAFTDTEMNLAVAGAYPYAGCVYFLGITNGGTEPIEVALGSLPNDVTVTCIPPGCSGADLDILAGGPDLATVNSRCRVVAGPLDGVANTGELLFTIEPGVTWVCPLFVTVLQSARQGGTYTVDVVPPPVPEDEVLGVKTPAAPQTGSGSGPSKLVQRSERGSGRPLMPVLVLLAGFGALLVLAWPRRAA